MRGALAVIALSSACSFTPAGMSEPASDGRAPDDAPVDAPAVAPPVAYWRFDTDGRDAMGMHDGTLVGGARVVAGGAAGTGGALSLAASGDRVDIGAPSGFNFNADFTWHVYVRTAASTGALLSRNPAGTAWNQGSKAMFVRSRTVQWDSGWVSNPRTGVTINDDAWHQIIATYVAATDTLDVFVDPTAGTTRGQYSDTHDVNRFDEHTHVHNDGLAETGLSIGAANFTGGLNDLGTLIGTLDEVAIFDRALKDEELDRLITGGPAAFVP